MTSHDFAVRRGFEWPFPEGFFLFGWPRIYGGLWGFHGFIPKWMANVQAGGIEGYSISIQTHLLFFESRGYFWMGVHTFIDWLLACSTSIDSMGIHIYIYIHWICVLVAFGCQVSYIFKVGQFHGIFIGSVCCLPCWGLTEFLLGESPNNFPFPHGLSLLDPPNGPYFQQVDSVGFIDIYQFTLHFPAPFSKKTIP